MPETRASCPRDHDAPGSAWIAVIAAESCGSASAKIHPTWRPAPPERFDAGMGRELDRPFARQVEAACYISLRFQEREDI
jgi:hypothetical protein